MTPDRCQGALSRAGYKKDHVANIDEWVVLAKGLKSGAFEVTDVPPACSYFFKMSAYLSQYYDTSGQRKTLDQEQAAIQKAHWIKFGAGPDESGTMVAHPGEVWYRDSYDVAAPIRKVGIARNLTKKKVDELKVWTEKAEWASYFEDEDLEPLSKFHKYDAPLELELALVKDLHKLSMLGLPSEKKDTFPAPDGCTCKYCVGSEVDV